MRGDSISIKSPRKSLIINERATPSLSGCADGEASILSPLLRLLEAHVESVRKAQVKFDLRISCAIYCDEGCNQGFHLSEVLVERTAKLGLSIDFDMYFLGDGAPTSSEI